MARTSTKSSEDTREMPAECPRCGGKMKLPAAVILRPETKALRELFAGTLNIFPCTACGVKFNLQVPLTFSDQGNACLIHCVETADAQKRAAAKKQLRKLAGEVAAGLEPPDCRLTFSRRRFIEKIALHLQDLDDRVVEYVKYQMYRRPDGGLDHVRQELLFDFSQEDTAKLAFIVFDRETGAAQSGVHIPMDVYDEMRDTLQRDDAMALELEQLFDEYEVTVDTLLEGLAKDV